MLVHSSAGSCNWLFLGEGSCCLDFEWKKSGTQHVDASCCRCTAEKPFVQPGVLLMPFYLESLDTTEVVLLACSRSRPYFHLAVRSPDDGTVQYKRDVTTPLGSTKAYRRSGPVLNRGVELEGWRS